MDKIWHPQMRILGHEFICDKETEVVIQNFNLYGEAIRKL